MSTVSVLSELFRLASLSLPDTFSSVSARVVHVTADSREVVPGTLFLAIRGSRLNGYDYINDAVARGAVCVVGEESFTHPLFVRVPSLFRFAEAVSAAIYDHPENSLFLTGITGTNGKTTTAHMVEKIVSSNTPIAVTGTVGYRFGSQRIAAPNTTPFIWKWYEILRFFVDNGAQAVVSEVSSHALEQNRIAGTKFDAALITNLTQDHLDYHQTMERYGAAKARLFSHFTKQGGTMAFNGDDPFCRTLFDRFSGENRVLFGMCADADIRGEVVEESLSGMKVRLFFAGSDRQFFLPMRGVFNLMNALGAAAVVSDRINPFDAFNRLEEGVSLAGRLERVGTKGFIYVDYAHTPDALERVLTALRSSVPKTGKLIVVFGAGGERDREKRPKMGAIAALLADYTVVTTDNPRGEKPSVIIDDILSGVSDNTHVTVIENREEAIVYAMRLLGKDDTLLIAGKGHEEYQIIGTEIIPFSDREVVLSHQYLLS